MKRRGRRTALVDDKEEEEEDWVCQEWGGSREQHEGLFFVSWPLILSALLPPPNLPPLLLFLLLHRSHAPLAPRSISLLQVISRGQFYKLPVLDDGGAIAITQETLEQKFEEIQRLSAGEGGGGLGAGILTTLPRDTWAACRRRLAATNSASLDAIDQALLVIALDPIAGLTVEEMEKNVLYGLPPTASNRWMDKATFIVCEDGQAGVNWEHSMLDGHTMMEMVAAVAAGFPPSASSPPPSSSTAAVCTVEPLALPLDAASEALAAEGLETALRLSGSCGVAILEYKGFGSGFIKGCKCSPDGFIQVALMLVYHALKGRHAVPYESVLAKAFRHGRVTVARNMSAAIAAGVEAAVRKDAGGGREERVAAFRSAVDDVARICREAASAQEFDRPFLALRRIAKLEGA